MSTKKSYTFLEKYDCSNYGPTVRWEDNVFYRIPEKEIIEAEKRLGFSFPAELRTFYQEIGAGRLASSHNPPPDYTFSGSNEILPPLTVAHFAKGEREWEGQRHWIAEDVVEGLKPGDLPFMDVSDSSIFMTMNALSKNPNAVWCLGDKIEDSLETFIRNLYYDDPAYYERKW